MGSRIPPSSPATRGGCTTATSSVDAALLRLRADSPLSGQRFRLRRPSLRRRPRRGRQGVQGLAISLPVGLRWTLLRAFPSQAPLLAPSERSRICDLHRAVPRQSSGAWGAYTVWWSACSFRFPGSKSSLSFWTLDDSWLMYAVMIAMNTPWPSLWREWLGGSFEVLS